MLRHTGSNLNIATSMKTNTDKLYEPVYRNKSLDMLKIKMTNAEKAYSF